VILIDPKIGTTPESTPLGASQALRRPKAVLPVYSIEKLVPQPQADVAFGLRTVK
jgi:hypothetical protein